MSSNTHTRRHAHTYRTDIGVVISLPSGGQIAAKAILIINPQQDDSSCPIPAKMHLSSIECCFKSHRDLFFLVVEFNIIKKIIPGRGCGMWMIPNKFFMDCVDEFVRSFLRTAFDNQRQSKH